MNSKWNYFASGFCLMAAIFFALIHNGSFLILECILVYWNWHLGEIKRKIENEQLKQNIEGNNGDE